MEQQRARLETVTAEHSESAALTEVLIREVGPERLGLTADSLRALADATFFNPLFGPDRGVLARAQSGNGLSLISDPDLRARVAGFRDRFEYYFVNQDMPGQIWMQSLLNTGSLVHPGIPEWESMGSSVMWSDPLTPEEVNAVKYLSMWKCTDEVMVSQSARLLVAMDSLLADLDAARVR